MVDHGLLSVSIMVDHGHPNLNMVDHGHVEFMMIDHGLLDLTMVLINFITNDHGSSKSLLYVTFRHERSFK